VLSTPQSFDAPFMGVSVHVTHAFAGKFSDVWLADLVVTGKIVV